MKPIYFPFTYVPPSVARALTAIFGGFIVYQPSGQKLPDEMRPWVEANVMEVRVPDRTDNQAIQKVVKDFRSFAGLHTDSKGLKTAAVLDRQAGIPFFSETATSRIVSDLKKGGSSDSAEMDSDPLFCARVFLDFAQDFDRQRDELNRGLSVHAQQSFELLKTLKGETEIDPASPASSAGGRLDDPGEYMTMARLQAWALLFNKDRVDSGLFATSSESVFDQLMAKVPAAEKIIQSAGMPADEINDKTFNLWRDSFLKHLNRLAETPWPVSGDIDMDLPLEDRSSTNINLTLYLVPGQIPREFFARYVERRRPPGKQPDQKVRFKNTLVGLVECQA